MSNQRKAWPANLSNYPDGHTMYFARTLSEHIDPVVPRELNVKQEIVAQEFTCPLCNRCFDDKTLLKSHAGSCDDDMTDIKVESTSENPPTDEEVIDLCGGVTKTLLIEIHPQGDCWQWILKMTIVIV